MQSSCFSFSLSLFLVSSSSSLFASLYSLVLPLTFFSSAARDRGFLLLGGAWNPATGAGIAFRSARKEEVEEFARKDPYVVNGIVTNWVVREWTVVVAGV